MQMASSQILLPYNQRHVGLLCLTTFSSNQYAWVDGCSLHDTT